MQHPVAVRVRDDAQLSCAFEPSAVLWFSARGRRRGEREPQPGAQGGRVNEGREWHPDGFGSESDLGDLLVVINAGDGGEHLAGLGVLGGLAMHREVVEVDHPHAAARDHLVERPNGAANPGAGQGDAVGLRSFGLPVAGHHQIGEEFIGQID